MEDNRSRIKASLKLFVKLNCCSDSTNGDSDDDDEDEDEDDDTALALVDEDKMRCHVINCLTALNLVQIKRKQKAAVAYNMNYELVKRKVFNAAILVVINDEFDSDEATVITILSAFPDEMKKSDTRTWLPMHFAIAFTASGKITEDDVRKLLSVDPLAMHRSSKKEDEDETERALTGCSPAHILCMQRHPQISLVRYLCLRDPQAFVSCDQSGRCTLHLVAQYSESLELVQCILQIDSKMTRRIFEMNCLQHKETTPLGLLCSRPQFLGFDKMVACLIEVDSSVLVIYDGMIKCLTSYDKCFQQNISPGSRGERSLILLRSLLNANPTVTKYQSSHIFHEACMNLRGELGISVLSLFLTEDSTGIKVTAGTDLPIHWAALNSCLDVLKTVHNAYPESILILGSLQSSLLHLAVYSDLTPIPDVNAKVRYLCEHCPTMIHLKDGDGGTPLHLVITNSRFNFLCLKILCETDKTIVREKWTPSDITVSFSGQLPLHCFIKVRIQMSEVSDEGDCFRLLLRLYPAAAGIKDDHAKTPYDIAVSKNLSSYFIRLLLSADRTLDPVKRHNLNFAARRQGMFLAFRALSSDEEPSIWAKIRFNDRVLLEHVIAYL